jgi:large subunit ribosomal protein L3
MRTLVEFRDEAGELQIGDTVTVEAFEVGQDVKVSGIGKGKGFQGFWLPPETSLRPLVLWVP